MIPSKSTRKSSRRSSILKPPKPRQPLQNLNFNNSSNESSPSTTKIKRRVSFAEKKHVKEFCNSAEQGTVWNNTYEEHDLSNLKISTSDEEKSQVEYFCKETIYSSTQENNVQFTYNEGIKKNFNIEDCSQNINLNKDVNCPDEMLLCAPLSVSFNDTVPQEDYVVQNVQQFNKPSTAMITVKNEDTSMELTVNVPSVIEPVDNVETAVCSADDELDDVFVELTAAVSTTLSDLQSNISKIDHYSSNLVINDNDNKSIIFNNDSMDIIDIVENSAKSPNRIIVMQKKPQHQYDTTNHDEKTKLLNVSMEMTQMVPVKVHSVTRSVKRNAVMYDAIMNNSKKSRYDIDTCEISINSNETRIYRDETMELTKAITASSEVHQNDSQIPEENTPCLQSNLDGTKICSDEEMEITKAVIIVTSGTHQSDSQIPVENTLYLQSNLGGTKTCNDEEMEFTRAVITTSSEVHRNDSQIPEENTPYLQSNLDGTKICSDEEMEITKSVITPTSAVHQNDPQILVESTPYLQPNLNGTKICSNEEMVITKAVITATSGAYQSDSQIPVENTPYLQSNLDGTKTCNDEEMELTKAPVTASSEERQNDSQVPEENTPYLQSNLDGTKICSDEEMEITKSVITPTSGVHQNDPQILVESTPYLQPNLNGTKICSNEEMVITKAVITGTSGAYQSDSQIPVENTPYLQSNLDGTKTCNDEEMELTKAPVTASSEEHQNDSQVPEENTPYLQSNLDGTKICSDEEMEITKSVIIPTSGVHQNDPQILVESTPYLQPNLNGTKICSNEEMVIIKAVITGTSGAYQSDSQIPVENTPYLQSNLDGTKTCNDEEMELTKAPVTASSEEHQNDSQVLVESTPYLYSNLEGTKICNDEEMEFTTAVTVSSEVHQSDDSQIPVEKIPCSQPNFDRTKICNDEEMEFTTAAMTASSKIHQNNSQIPAGNTPCLQSNLDGTRICNDEEMEFTRAVITTSSEVYRNDSQIPEENTPYLQSNLDGTKICSNEEMEITKSVITPTSGVDQNDPQIPVESTPYLQPNLNGTKICSDEEMEITKAVITATSGAYQSDSQIPVENTPYLQSNLDGTKTCNDEEMELTKAPVTASSEEHQNDSQVLVESTPYLYSNLDGTKICNDEEMEFTTAVTVSSEVHQSDDSQIPVEKIPCSQPNFDRTKICNDEEMEFTTAAMTASSKVHQNNSQIPAGNTPYLQSNLDGTKTCNDEEMELTTAPVTASSEEHQNDSQVLVESTPYLYSNLDGTKICNDEEMEFATAVTVASELDQNDLQIAVEKIPCLQPNFSNSILETCKNDCANSISNGTTIFYNNSMTMTKVVSLLNTDVAIDSASDKNNQESSKTVLFPNISMEVTDTVATAQPHSQADDSAVNSINVMQSVLSKSSENRDLVTHSEILADKILKDSISLSLNFDRIQGKENSTGLNSTKDAASSLVEDSASVEVQSSANIKPSMALHESMQQHACVSALKENNTEKACVTFNPGNGSFSPVNLQINNTEPMQNPTSGSRRTYIIQPLNNDQILQCSNGGNNTILETSRETPFHDLNDKENSACNITNVQTEKDYNGECSMEKLVAYSNESLEQIDLIEPSVLACLDDVSNTNTFTSITCNQEIDMEKNCFSAKENIKPEDCSKSIVNYSNHNSEYNNEETVNKSQTFVIKCRLNEQLESSALKQDQEQTNKIPELQLIDVKDTNANIQVLECSSSTMTDNEKFVASNGKKDVENLCRDDCYLDNQSMEYSSSNIIPIHESTPKVNNENNDKLITAHVMETDNQSYCNEQIKLTVEPDTTRVEENIPIEVDSFSSLMNKLRACAKSDDIIWEVYHENIERNVFVIGFISCSLLVIIYVRDLCDVTSDRYIKEVKLTSRLAEHAGVLLGIIHRVILEKLDGKKLLDLYGTRGDILPMLDHITKEVKLAMDFMFEVKHLNDINLMEITRESISFISRTKRMDIILKITMYIKPFDRIEPEDISVHCILGSVREEDVKILIKNIKRDHKFLRRYMNDVRDYIYLMEECCGVIEKSD